MLFRIYRHRLCPGSEAKEAAMEKQEGLAEYTGVCVARRDTGEKISREARIVEAFEDSDAFARSFGYATGPALGLLLDRYALGWREHAASASLESLLISALHIQAPANLPMEVQHRAALYRYTAVAAAEHEREERHQAVLAELPARFIKGPVPEFSSPHEMHPIFNPTTLTPFTPHQTYH